MSYIFIIGAGASADIGLPTGYQLQNKINNTFTDFSHSGSSGAVFLKSCLRMIPGFWENQGGYAKAYKMIERHALNSPSIDNFINENKEIKEIAICSKLGIAYHILNGEVNSIYKHSDILDAGRKTWHANFFIKLKEGCENINDFEEKMDLLTLIIFNYDRCLEHYLFNAIKSFYDLSEGKASEVMSKINIIHPYGKLSNLPWENNASDFLKYGENIFERQGNTSYYKLISASENIKTFTESTNEKSVTELISKKIMQSKLVVFIGFGFNKLNMDLLYSKERKIIQSGDIIFSAFDMPVDDIDYVREMLIAKNGKDLGRSIFNSAPNAKCKDMFNEFNMRLAMA